MLLVGADSEITWSELPGIAFTEKGAKMKKLIEVHAFANCPVFSCGGNPNDPYYAGYCDALDRVVEWMENFPAVDAVPVVHGRWLYDSGSGKHFCSSCNEDALSFKKDTLWGGDLYEVCLTDYCPHCGAKMDLGVE